MLFRSYSRPAIVLFTKITALCLEVPEDNGPPNPPYIVPGTGNHLIGQVWGRELATGGVTIYYSLAEDGETVRLWDCEEQGYGVKDLGPPLHTFPLEKFEGWMKIWLLDKL